MRSDALAGLAQTLNIAVVAADADGPDWQIPGVPSFPGADGAAELAYFDALRDDLIQRFAVDPERIVATGFSAGGMMTWHLACHRGDAYAGFVPLAGTFWAPLPESCPTTAVDLIHYHGTADSIVPIEGRPIADTRQGDVREAMALFTRPAATARSTASRRPAWTARFDATRRSAPRALPVRRRPRAAHRASGAGLAPARAELGGLKLPDLDLVRCATYRLSYPS